VRKLEKKWAPLIREAKEELRNKKTENPQPGSTGLTPLRVKSLTALVVAHTRKLPKAKNNKDGALKTEAALCLKNPVVVHTPPPSPPRTGGAQDDAQVDGDGTSDDEEVDFGGDELANFFD